MNIKLITDSGCSLTKAYFDENHIAVVPLQLCIKGEFLKDDQTLSYKEFYELLRQGEVISTSQPNAHSFEEVFEQFIEDEIIYIGLSSGLSGTYNSATIAKENLLEKYPQAKIHLIDTKTACAGQGLLVQHAAELLEEGKSADEIINWLEENKMRVNHAITVDDLDHIKRGGRISGAAAAIGGLLNIKPILSLDSEGKVIAVGKVKGRKKMLRYLADEIINKSVKIEDQIIYIAHADCEEEAELIKSYVLEKVAPKAIHIGYIGTVIGVHGGPGAMTVMFLGNER